ncbi:hypothetical protein E2C01_096811 [Portunus trituberculatus]|uniref:Uncharacterized protein n=1 Tax=Portunus trituberculatus TaxID=210409 RepID=A0A5B7JWL0_PORTR|nr:hypothetical protein [Portunus trituberculatus]
MECEFHRGRVSSKGNMCVAAWVPRRVRRADTSTMGG